MHPTTVSELHVCMHACLHPRPRATASHASHVSAKVTRPQGAATDRPFLSMRMEWDASMHGGLPF